VVFSKRIVWCDEFDKKAKVDVKMLKEIADGKKISNEVMYGTSEGINVRGKMFIIGNHTLNFDNDGGSANRFRQLQFDSHFGNYEKDDYEALHFVGDKHLAEKLKTKYALDLINILIDYGHRYCNEGKLIDMPEEFKEITADTVKSNNHFQDWFDENIVVDWKYRLTKKDMMEATHGLEFKELCDSLRAMGYKYDSNKQKMVDGKRTKGLWIGIKLVE